MLSSFGHTDNGSLHGLDFGPDGLLYGTLGSHDGYRIARAVGTVVTGTTGSLFRCRSDGTHPEFLTTDDPDFRPAGVLEDADGSLLVLHEQVPHAGVVQARPKSVDGLASPPHLPRNHEVHRAIALMHDLERLTRVGLPPPVPASYETGPW